MKSPLAVIYCKITNYSNLDPKIRYNYNNIVYNISDELYIKYDKPYVFGFSPLKDDRTIIHSVIYDLNSLPFLLIHFMYLIRNRLEIKSLDLKISVGIGEAHFNKDAEASDLGEGESYDIVKINYETMKKDWYFSISTNNQMLNPKISQVINTINYNLRGDQSLLDQVVNVIDEGRYKTENPESINKKNIHHHAKEILVGLFLISKELEEYVLDIRHVEQVGFNKSKEPESKKMDDEEKVTPNKKEYTENQHLNNNKIVRNRLNNKKRIKNKSFQKKNKRRKIIALFMAPIIASLILIIIDCFIQWEWLLQHPNSYALQSCIFVSIVFSIIGLFVKEWRKTLWIALIGYFGILISLLGGPGKS